MGPGRLHFSFAPPAARDIVLGVDDVRRVDGLDALLAGAEGTQPGMVFTSLGIAMVEPPAEGLSPFPGAVERGTR